MIFRTVFIVMFAVGALAQDNVQASKYGHKLNDIVKELCKKNGAEDKSAEVQGKILDARDCLQGLFDYKIVTNEIEEAKPRGALDEVFKKYCDKSPQLKSCLRGATSGIKPCAGDLSINVDVLDSVADKLIEFICYNNGDRIALAIAEGTPECLRDQQNGITECFTVTKNNVNTAKQALDLRAGCTEYDQLSACIVTELEKCSSPTPSNMAESLLRFIRNVTPCKNL